MMILSKKIKLYQSELQEKNCVNHKVIQYLYIIGHLKNKKKIIKILANLYLMEFLEKN